MTCTPSLRKSSPPTTTSPQICCRTTLQNVNVQLSSFTTQLIQSEVIQRRLITVSDHEGCYSGNYLHPYWGWYTPYWC